MQHGPSFVAAASVSGGQLGIAVSAMRPAQLQQQQQQDMSDASLSLADFVPANAQPAACALAPYLQPRQHVTQT